jgi:hypothetical protein
MSVYQYLIPMLGTGSLCVTVACGVGGFCFVFCCFLLREARVEDVWVYVCVHVCVHVCGSKSIKYCMPA